jgi:phosphopentomutase
VCTYDNFAGTGLTRAVLRGGRWGGTVAEGDAVARAVDAASQGNRSLVYVYVSALDLVGHMRGPDTDAWCAQLAIVDRIAERLVAGMEPGVRVYVTADHGMVSVADDVKVDYDSTPVLQDGVVALAGEPRMRHVHVRPGAVADVCATWAKTLGDGWQVMTGDDAIADGLFGPIVTTAARPRIGDVIAFAAGPGSVVERRKLPRLASMPGHHGSLTDEELLVPLLASS